MNLATLFYILLAVTVALVVTGVMIYNNLADIKHTISQNINVLLKQHHDELPKLVKACGQYMRFEQETLSKIMKARDALPAPAKQAVYLLWA